MKVLFLIGAGAAGKMTVGQEVMKRTGLRLFHNHMAIEPVIEIFGSFNGRAIARIREVIFEELAASDDPSALRGEEVTSKNVWDAYKDGDALAARVVEKFARYLGRALGIIASTVDPDVFIIGGGVSNAGDPLIDAVTAVYREMAFSSCKDTPIVLAKIGNDAGIYGAAKLALDAAQA